MRRLVLKCVWSLPGGCDDENNNLDYNGVDFDDNNDGNGDDDACDDDDDSSIETGLIRGLPFRQDRSYAMGMMIITTMNTMIMMTIMMMIAMMMMIMIIKMMMTIKHIAVVYLSAFWEIVWMGN